ncbi:MAG: TIGR03905 family TSCPD domain-containing protein [Bacteroidales bacterium]|nr:TIGR03905 family TSCPD domain-containing protein [Bacteroidales bacterium]MBQ2573756.1 TIGR03905 family TSCPD domain-containing protein [Bacteroidales bacterium]
MKYQYRTQGTCSEMIEFEIVDGKLHNVQFYGGCHGNLQGIGKLVEGMDANEVIAKLGGIRCGYKDTSCPDQLCKAIRFAMKG